VKFVGGLHRRVQAATFFREDVEDDRAVALFGELQVFDEFVDVMTVDGAEIA